MPLKFAATANQTMRPPVMARHHAVVSGHYWASQAGFQILEAGGNAVDAGIAVAIAINVLEPEMCNFLGVAPMLIHLPDRGEMVSIAGVGPWPKTVSTEYFHRRHGGRVPPGLLRCVVPAAPENYITALERYGTLSFGDVAAAAIRFATGGFPMYAMLRGRLLETREHGGYFRCPENDAVFCPGGRVPELGETVVQADLGGMLRFLVDEERSHASHGRARGLQAVRDAVYRGDIARRIVLQQKEQDGQINADDLASFSADVEQPCHRRFHDIDLYAGGQWGQGPMLLSALGMLEGFDLRAMGHNSAAYIHSVAEALKLAAADRETYFGDPRFGGAPIDELLSDAYTSARRALIRPGEAWPGMPPAGPLGGANPRPWQPDPSSGPDPVRTAVPGSLETSYLCVADRWGNVFSATISDPAIGGPLIAGLGAPCCSWGSRAYTGPDHPARVEPGKRPRMSTAPQLAIWPDGTVMPFGSPGSEVLGQAQVQAFLNVAVFGMDPQTAVEAPRFASSSWPGSALPHSYHPGRLDIESRIASDVGQALTQLGHKVHWWPERIWLAGSVCAILRDGDGGLMVAGADPRRTAYAIGW
jgi:gamma-glutamyltranspeptidase/glutathione hydrolase